MLKNIRIVLVSTSHPGNIGAVARAMKNMCLSRLCLVAPKRYPSEEAVARASGAQDLLDAAEIFDDLDSALQGCRLVIGTSARERSVAWSVLNPRECGGQVIEEAAVGEVALVFGRENSGLSNEELDRCNLLVHIPTNSDYSSLNLGAAVQLLAYEVYLASLEEADKPLRAPREVASAEMLEGFHTHLAQALEDIGFADPRQSDKLLRRLRALFHRARPDRDEINILRGILSAAQGRKSMRR
ncbi:RNA methyltransferase [endosymbiont of Ridgeia piscesae]|jgi:tRNA (cytidine32/uridine32-2'-O)-methyltransferase|uniref:tRNA (cytidine/uridine-2'-O-)-methyltransferase TrmJ n=1 Tax=endosymbiont of Ridgeia piscesae TaxID=54398 RepID=A0A0T5YZL9_9GAMM|nr:RNA methyltransferase [endosymbiont of Ridgeia piscesae]KRT55996.1 RNA methyltransferase, TrmH family, group 1 [endosymbiont of Ridgeia piscesae]KRT59843.1 tRNA (cytidine32/uridine32-2'-O)-methyltransferase [endosymbiont of Ridgeia piscesae]